MLINVAYAANAKDDDVVPIKEISQEVVEPTDVSSYPAWFSMIPMVLIFIVFYFLLIRPQEKRRREREKLVSNVKKGEEVMTSAGIFGKITKINDADNSVNLLIAENTEIRILKSAIIEIISRKLESSDNGGAAQKAAKKPKNKPQEKKE